MKRPRRLIAASSAAVLATVLSTGLTGCSANMLIWGPEGTRVIETTEQLIDAAASSDPESFVCEGYEPEMREPTDWEGLSAEEPEEFVPEYWEQMVPLEPDWSINLSLPEDRTQAGTEYPGDVFYQQTDDGLCLVGVAWWTVE